MLQYLYTTNYEDGSGHGKDPLLFNVQVHTVADKYDVTALASLACFKFFRQAGRDWRTTEFAEAVEEIYDGSTDSKQALKEEVIKVCVDNATELFAKQDADQAPLKLRDVANSVPCFSADLAAALAEKLRLSTEQLELSRSKVSTDFPHLRYSYSASEDGYGLFD